MLTQERLKELLDYDPETGVFIRKIKKGGMPAGSVAGSADACGYIVISIDGKRHKAHRLAWLWVYGELPKKDIDHINRIPCDNRIANLREVNKKQNAWNTDMKKNNASGFLGVYKHKQCARWGAKICVNRKQHYLGLFDTPEEAHAAYMRAKEKLHNIGC